MSFGGQDVDVSKLTPAQQEIGARLVLAQDRLSSLAPFLFSAWMDTVGLGIVLYLVIRWWLVARSTERRTAVRLLVGWLSLCALAGTTWLSGQMLVDFGEHFGIYRTFLSVAWRRWGSVVGGASRVPASLFYLHRAYMLCDRKWWVPAVCLPPILAIFPMAVAICVRLNRLPYPDGVTQMAVAALSAEVFTDVILSVTIAVQLYRSKTGWSGTDQLIMRLLKSLAETQTPPTILAIIMLTSFLVWPDSTVQGYFLFHAKVHIICILVVLLSRVDIKEETEISKLQSKQSKGSNSHSSGSGAGTGSKGVYIPSSRPGTASGGHVYGGVRASFDAQGKRIYGHALDDDVEHTREPHVRISSSRPADAPQRRDEMERDDAESLRSEPISGHVKTMGGSDVALVPDKTGEPAEGGTSVHGRLHPFATSEPGASAYSHRH